MFSSSPSSTPATSPTNSPSVSAAAPPSEPSCRASRDPRTTCREARAPRTSRTWPDHGNPGRQPQGAGGNQDVMGGDGNRRFTTWGGKNSQTSDGSDGPDAKGRL